MKGKKQQIYTMIDCLLLGVFILYGNNIPYGSVLLIVIGWFKLMMGLSMFGLVFLLGIITVLEKDK